MSINSLSRLGVTSIGADCYGDLTATANGLFTGTVTCSASVETSDKELKENV